MHKMQLTHTDLKPENILLQFDDLKMNPFRTYQAAKTMDKVDKSPISRFSRSSTRSQSRFTQNQYKNQQMVYEPYNDKIKIIDMGGATWDDEYHSSIIQTRQYRSPRSS